MHDENTQILRGLNSIYKELKLNDKELTLASHFNIDLNFDDLDFVEFIIKVEDEFGIYITQEVADTFYYVEDIVDYIKNTPENEIII